MVKLKIPYREGDDDEYKVALTFIPPPIISGQTMEERKAQLRPIIEKELDMYVYNERNSQTQKYPKGIYLEDILSESLEAVKIIYSLSLSLARNLYQSVRYGGDTRKRITDFFNNFRYSC